MDESEFELDLDELSSAEEFLEYFGIAYDPAVVQVNRLHILQRFHDYIDDMDELPVCEQERRELYAGLLKSAYSDFVTSDALTERVFKVLHRHTPISIEVPLMELLQQGVPSASKV